MMKRVSGWRSISAVPASRLPQNRMLTGKSWRTAARRIRSRPGSSGARVRLLRQHDADADRARRLLPVGDDIGHRRIVRVDRLDDGEPVGMGPLHFHRIAGVVVVHRKGGDEDRAVDADLVHRRHHLVAGDVIGPVRHAVPGPLRRVRLIGMDLGIDDRHRGNSSVLREFGCHSRSVSRAPRLGTPNAGWGERVEKGRRGAAKRYARLRKAVRRGGHSGDRARGSDLVENHVRNPGSRGSAAFGLSSGCTAASGQNAGSPATQFKCGEPAMLGLARRFIDLTSPRSPYRRRTCGSSWLDCSSEAGRALAGSAGRRRPRRMGSSPRAPHGVGGGRASPGLCPGWTSPFLPRASGSSGLASPM